MIALVCEKVKFSGKADSEGDKPTYYTLTLAAYNDYAGDYRIVTQKADNGKYVPRKYFVPESLYNLVQFGKVYDFIWACDSVTGNSSLVDAIDSKLK